MKALMCSKCGCKISGGAYNYPSGVECVNCAEGKDAYEIEEMKLAAEFLIANFPTGRMRLSKKEILQLLIKYKRQ